jgi:hypothetical protein
MDTFDTIPKPLGDTFPHSRVHAHLAAQLVAAAGLTLLPPDPEFHFSSTTFDPKLGALVGSPLPRHRQVRLVLAELRIEVVDRDTVAEARLLGGSTMAEAGEWLGEVLGEPLVYPTWDLPWGTIETFGPFEHHAYDLGVLTAWYGAAHHTLSVFVPPQGTASEVRVWPHHFDLATLVTFGGTHTVGLGLSPGDEAFAFPYLYVTPWPYPRVRATPPLPVGRWNTDTWYGALLDAEAVTGQSAVDTFFEAAFASCAGAAST